MNPIHPHCGLNLSYSATPSGDPVDDACREHDIGYERLGKKAYFLNNKYDDEFRKRMKTQDGWLPRFYKGFFDVKAAIMPTLVESTNNQEMSGDVIVTPAKSVRGRSRSRSMSVDARAPASVAWSGSGSRRIIRKVHKGKSGKGLKKRKRKTKRRSRKSKRKSRRGSRKSAFLKMWYKAKSLSVMKTIYNWEYYNIAGAYTDRSGNIASAEQRVACYGVQFLPYADVQLTRKQGQNTTALVGKFGIFEAPGQKVYNAGVVIGNVQFTQSEKEVFLIKYHEVRMEITNADKIPCDVWVFVICCKKDTEDSWDAEFLEEYRNQSVFDGSKGDNPLSAPGRATLYQDPDLPSNIKGTDSWKISAKTHFKLAADETHVIPVKYAQSNMVFDNQKQATAGTGVTPSAYMKGISYQVVIMVRGQLGKSTQVETLRTLNQTGYCAANINVLCHEKVIAARATQFGASQKNRIWDQDSLAALQNDNLGGGIDMVSSTALPGAAFKLYEDTLTQY